MQKFLTESRLRLKCTICSRCSWQKRCTRRLTSRGVDIQPCVESTTSELLAHSLLCHRIPLANSRRFSDDRNYFQTRLINLEPKTSSGKWRTDGRLGSGIGHLAEIAAMKTAPPTWCFLRVSRVSPWEKRNDRAREASESNGETNKVDLAPANRCLVIDVFETCAIPNSIAFSIWEYISQICRVMIIFLITKIFQC